MSCITEILKLKGDKEFLLAFDVDSTPWIAVEGGGIYKDHEYLIVLNKFGHRCGYVAIPSNHKFDSPSWNYDSLDIECHGGLTFMARHHDLKDLLTIPCNDLWVGFDCGHCFDNSDVKAFTKYFGEKEAKEKQSFFNTMNISNRDEKAEVRTYEYTESECHSIIDQLIEKAA